jgi:MADS-box transcription factor, plant
MRELEIGYHQVQHDRDFISQMPFTFRVQPNHPNLQEDE